MAQRMPAGVWVAFGLSLAVWLSPAPVRADLDDVCLRCYNFINAIFRPAPAEDIERYRKSWNPFAAGPMLNPAIDIQPKGQTVVHPYVFGQTGHALFGNQFGTDTTNNPTHLSASLFLLPYEYGITDSLEGVIALSWVDWFATQQHGSPSDSRNAHGLGDTSLFLKHRLVVQDPDSWRPTVTWFHGWVLPSSKWAETTPIPGGFAPIGRLPSTRFGDQTFTEGIMLRKNLQPFRLMAAGYYSYGTPGNAGGVHKYGGDLINWRVMVEHVLDDARGFGYVIEFMGLHGLAWRLDGHGVNIAAPAVTTHPHNTPVFNILGAQPTIEYKFSNNIVIAGGVLFTPFGQNNLNAVYPNFTLYYYWGSKGRPVLMR
ncbi:hypothetical protein [Nitrospira sp. Kam-Ns4a]